MICQDNCLIFIINIVVPYTYYWLDDKDFFLVYGIVDLGGGKLSTVVSYWMRLIIDDLK